MVKLKRIVLLCTLLLPLVAGAQTVTVSAATGQNIETFINNNLVGKGVYIWNVKFNNVTGNISPSFPQIGTFNSNGYQLLWMDSGVVMTTSHVNDASPSGGYGSLSGNYHDPVMQSWGGTSRTVNDCATIDFDFVSMSPFVTVNYCFGSNEYPSYTCSQFNDIFGFIIEGPYPSTTRKNAAIIPHTVSAANPYGIEVAINTVNSGTCSSGYTAGPGTYLIYSDYFVSNPNSTGVNYPGFTQKLSANATLIPCERYHMHISICDVSDGALDSGVFLEKNSFNSPSADVSLSHRYADTIERNRGAVLPLNLEGSSFSYSSGDVIASFGGTAVVGQDYTVTTCQGEQVDPDHPTFTIDATGCSLTFLGTPTANLTEPKLIEMYLKTALCHNYPALKTYDTIRYILVEDDVVRLRHDTIVAYDTCKQVGVELAIGNHPPFSFHWEPETDIDFPYQQFSTATITESRNYTVSVVDGRGDVDTTNVYVKILPRTPQGIEEQPEADFEIYPNPTSGEINLTADGITLVEVFNASGVCVFSRRCNDDCRTVDIRPLVAGMYTVRITTNLGTKTEKVIVR